VVAAAQDELLVLRTARGRIGLTATVLASATAMLDSTVANVALPEIGRDFGADVAGLQWVITGYLLTLASFILLGGAAGDRWGRRRVFVVGAIWFGAASVVCGLAPNLQVLIAARVVQGVGAALVTPSSLALLQASFVPDDRGKAVGAWSGLGGLAGAIGPFVGGWLIDGPGWRWAFLINLPLLGAAVVATRVFPETGTDRSGHFDVAGALLAVVCLAPLTWALTESSNMGWGDPRIVTALVVSAAAAVAFVVRQRRAPVPLVPPVLFRSRNFTVLNIVTFVLYAALGAEFFLSVYQLQVTSGWSALAAGSALLPATIIMLIGSSWSGQLATRIGPRPQLVIGPLLVAAGLIALAGIDADTNWVVDVAPGAVLFGLGLVTFVAPLTASVMGSVDEVHVSTASGVNNAVARTGGLLAVALIPPLVGLTTAVGPEETTDAYRSAMYVIAGLAVVSAVISAIGLRAPRSRRSAREFTCAVDGAPLQPDPHECPPVTVPARRTSSATTL
jgi:EmrB/QacA subfamily drug resistance transporter